MKYAGGLKMLDILVWLDVQYLRQFSGHSLRMSFLQHSIFKAYWVCPEILVYTTLVKRTFNMKVRPSFFFCGFPFINPKFHGVFACQLRLGTF